MIKSEIMENYKEMRKDYEDDETFMNDNGKYIYQDLKKLGIEEGSTEWVEFMVELLSK